MIGLMRASAVRALVILWTSLPLVLVGPVAAQQSGPYTATPDDYVAAGAVGKSEDSIGAGARGESRTGQAPASAPLRNMLFPKPSQAAPLTPGIVPPAVGNPVIEWRVENPFRFFNDPADTETHRATFLALTPEERRTPILSAERALGSRTEEGWAAPMYRKTCWDWARNRYVCPDSSKPYVNPDSHIVVAALQGFGDAPATVECVWTAKPRGEGRSQKLTQSCAEPVKLSIPYPDGATVEVTFGGSEPVVTEVKVRDLFIVGMGDSFGSGEGNPDIPVRFSRERAADYGNGGSNGELLGLPARIGSWKTIGDTDFIEENARWLDQACHRSLYSNQLRTALQLAIEDPHRAVTFASVACSGAEVVAGLFLRYKGNEWVPRPPELSQVSAIAEVQCGAEDAPMQDLPEAYHIDGRIPELQGGLVLRKCDQTNSRRIDLLLVSIGGNDIGFARLVANAVLADQSLLKKLGGWFGQVYEPKEARSKFPNVEARYKSLKRATHNILHIPWEEADRVILTAYPGMSLLDSGRNVCPDGQAGMEVFPDFRLSEKKARESEKVADALNGLMKKMASAYGWTFADAHRAQFIGRGLCAGYTDNALSQADDLRIPRRVDGAWVPYNPADFKAYAPRQRWFRTPNDAFMTGNFHASAGVMQRVLKLEAVSYIQVMLAATYSGAFHPTAEGHAAIADAATDKARAVLAKYEKRRRRAVEDDANR